MSKSELSNLTLNKRVIMWYLSASLESQYRFGYVTKIYNGNYQVQVWFDGGPKPVVVGYSQIDIIWQPLPEIPKE